MQTDSNIGPGLAVLKADEIPHLLGEGEVGAVLELTVFDPRSGRVTERRRMKSESFVRQFIDILWIQMGHIAPDLGALVTDIGGVPWWMPNNLQNFQCNAGLGDVNNGPVVGTSGVAPLVSDFALQSLIGHGVGAGQLQYSAVTFGAPASDAVTSQFTITRDFANGSGNQITVNEIGLYVNMARGSAGVLGFMTIRDVIGGGIAVPNGQTLTVNYRIQATV